MTIHKLSSKQIIGLGENLLDELMKDGIVSNMTILKSFQSFDDLRGVAISISAAARKYNIPQGTISRWVSKGYIKKMGMDKNRVLIDESDIATVADIYRKDPGHGRSTVKKLVDVI